MSTKSHTSLRLRRTLGIAFSDRTTIVGCAVLGSVLAVCVVGPFFAPDPLAPDLSEVLEGPSSSHWLGTDQLGRDVLARLLHAGRLDIRIAITAVLLSFTLGVGLGALAAFRGGWLGSVIVRVADIVSALPVMVMAIALIFVLGQGERSFYVAFTFTGWVTYARITRAEVLTVTSLDYVTAARISGLPGTRVLWRHVLPNAIGQSLTFVMIDVVYAMAAIVALGFLGLGIQPPTPEWGSMIADGEPLIQVKPALATIPGLAVFVTAVGFALTGDGLASSFRREGRT